MTEYDRYLIKLAENLDYTEWAKAGELAKQAESPEAKETLRRIQKILYHKEEYFAGLL